MCLYVFEILFVGDPEKQLCTILPDRVFVVVAQHAKDADSYAMSTVCRKARALHPLNLKACLLQVSPNSR